MFEFFSAVLTFLSYVWRGIEMALQLNPRLLPIVQTYPQSGYIILTIAILAGVSQLLGQSVVLFVNQVRPGRFVASLLMNGLLFALSLIVWGVTTWLAARFLFAVEQPLRVVIRIVALGSAPFVFGFLMLVPYLGTLIGRVLFVWSLLIVLAGVGGLFQVGFFASLVCVGLGWLLMVLLSMTIGKPVVAVRNWIWHRVVGSPLDATAQDILTSFAQNKQDDPTAKGGKA